MRMAFLDKRGLITAAAVCSLGYLLYYLLRSRKSTQKDVPPRPSVSPEAEDERCGDCCHSDINLEEELTKFVSGQAHYPSCPNNTPERFQISECGCHEKKQAHSDQLKALANAQPNRALEVQPSPVPPPPIPVRRTPSTAVDKWVVGKTQSLEELYDIGDLIGEGQFGKAYFCTHKATGELRAVKVISKRQFWDDHEQRYAFGELRDEIAILQDLDSPHLINYIEALESSGYLYLVMECCKGGELFDRIQAQQHYSEKDAVGVLQQIGEALRYLHRRKIAHCDLKPDNCLFIDNTPESRLVLIDFGMSKHIPKRRYLSMMRGTPFYVAPEVLQGKYAEHCDIWSFGVVMFVMLFGFPPFYGKTNEEIYAKIEGGFQNTTKAGYGPWFPANIPCSADAKDLIARCLDSNHATRLSADEVLEHKFMNGGASVLPFELSVGLNFSGFRENNKLRGQVLCLMANTLDKKELGALKQVFKEMDTNGDGVITKEELKQALCKQGVQNTDLLKQVEVVMRAADMDGDGSLSYEELVLTAVQRKLHAKEERLWEAFCQFDKDHDGSISAAEVAEVLAVSEAEARLLIQEIDENGDGVVDYDEFRTMMMAKERSEVAPLLEKQQQEHKAE